MALVDSHCHLQTAAFDADRDEVLARALDRLAWLVVVGDELDHSREALAMTGPRVRATVGIHPHHAVEADGRAFGALRELALDPRAAAVGEVGLDYYYEHAPRDRQREALLAQLDLAATIGKPVVIHCRDAEDDMAAILEDAHARLSGGVMHCFSGTAAFAERCLAWGFHVSFAGNVTVSKADAIRDAAAIVPMDRLLVETDSPYLAPHPLRGKRCEPAFVEHTARFIADLKGVPFDEFTECTTENAARLFGV